MFFAQFLHAGGRWEDFSARRNLKKFDQIEARKWQRKHLRETWERLLYEPWMLDIDATVKTVFGHQEGAEVGYNPHKPGRPSNGYHTYWIARLRLCLDGEVRPGKQSSSSHGMPALWKLIDALPLECRPHAIRGDCNYGNEANTVKCEKRGIPYLFKLRLTAKVKNLISMLEQEGGWVDYGQGFKGIEEEVGLGWVYNARHGSPSDHSPSHCSDLQWVEPLSQACGSGKTSRSGCNAPGTPRRRSPANANQYQPEPLQNESNQRKTR